MTYSASTTRYDNMPYRRCGASIPADAQITELAGALNQQDFSAEELKAIDQHAVDGGINLWQRPSTDQRP